MAVHVLHCEGSVELWVVGYLQGILVGGGVDVIEGRVAVGRGIGPVAERSLTFLEEPLWGNDAGARVGGFPGREMEVVLGIWGDNVADLASAGLGDDGADGGGKGGRREDKKVSGGEFD